MREDWVEVSEHQVRKGIARGWRKYGIWQRVHELKNIWLEYSLRKSVFHVILELTYRYIWNRPLDLTFVNQQRQKMRSLGTTISQVINLNSNRIMIFFRRCYYFFFAIIGIAFTIFSFPGVLPARPLSPHKQTSPNVVIRGFLWLFLHGSSSLYHRSHRQSHR